MAKVCQQDVLKLDVAVSDPFIMNVAKTSD